MRSTSIQLKDLKEYVDKSESNEVVSVKKIKTTRRTSFMAVETYQRHAYLETLDFSPSEQRVMKLLVLGLDTTTNVTTVSSKGMTQVQRNDFSNGYKMLNKKKIVIRTKKGRPSTYMISPMFIQPFGDHDDYGDALKKWENRTNSTT